MLLGEDIRLFANFYHGSTTGEDRYQLASASMMFGWQDPLSSQSIFNQTLQNSPDEVNALLPLIAAKTGLPLYRF